MAAGRGSRSPSGGSTSFARNEQNLYFAYEKIALNYPGWGLSDIRGLTVRERICWLKLIDWRRDKVRV
jgi:hypothetical protein